MDYKSKIKEYINDEIKVLQNINIEEINNAINLLEETRKNGGTIFIFGNGGSATTSLHIQSDFSKGWVEKLEKRYKINCLSNNMATMMAIANDDSYENIFLNQITNNVNNNDIAIAISTSGNSKNVIKAVEYIKNKGNKIISFTGYNGGRLKELSDIKLQAFINNTQVSEDIHTIFGHIMMYILKNSIED